MIDISNSFNTNDNEKIVKSVFYFEDESNDIIENNILITSNKNNGENNSQE